MSDTIKNALSRITWPNFTHNEIGQSIAYDFMRYFWDSQRSLDFGPVAG